MTLYLVGAGPGEPDQLTVRARRLLQVADVVVHDRVISPDVLALIPEGVLRIDVGKRPGHRLAQEDINGLLVHLGRRHDTVVRLKSGDPLLFGRGGEELVALRNAGVAVEVVPGVSGAVAVPALAGIPITHRGMAATVTVVTGHGMEGTEPVDWDALAQLGGTLVVLMGAGRAREIADNLRAGGLPDDTPVAAIRQGPGTIEQHRGTLAELRRDGSALGPPLTLVIGAVAALDVTADATLAGDDDGN